MNDCSDEISVVVQLCVTVDVLSSSCRAMPMVLSFVVAVSLASFP